MHYVTGLSEGLKSQSTSVHMVSITWHTKNTPPKQPFWHMYLVIPCAHGI